MNILFVLYGDFGCNSANPLVLYARELSRAGHSCVIAVPSNLETVALHEKPSFSPRLYDEVLSGPGSVFLNGLPADVIHACTPREGVRRFVYTYMQKYPTPCVVSLEDNEPWISQQVLGISEKKIGRFTEKEISDRLGLAYAHPFIYDKFIGLADAVVVIQDKLKIMVPPWVYCETVMLGVDLNFFSPRPPDEDLRAQYGVGEKEKVIVYHGGMNNFTKQPMKTLCQAIGLINEQGFECRLLRTGPFALDFLEQLNSRAVSQICDLGEIPKKDLPDLLALGDVFVQPGAKNAFEDLRLPGKIPEFLAMRRPVVIPDANISHLFQDGIDAILLKTGSAEEIAQKCVELFSDERKAEKIGYEGRRLAEKIFDVKRQARLLEAVYGKAMQIFHANVAAKVWGEEGGPASASERLVRKLEMMAGLDGPDVDDGKKELMQEYAKNLKVMQNRIRGLEEHLAERNIEIDVLKEQVLERETDIERIHASKSMKITAPLRLLAHHSRFYYRLAKNFQSVICHSGGLLHVLRKGISVLKRDGLTSLFFRMKQQVLGAGLVVMVKDDQKGYFYVGRNNYEEWIRLYDCIDENIRKGILARIESKPKRPKISVIMPVFDPPLEFLDKAIWSVRNQIYPEWELCIADDASKKPEVRNLIHRHMEDDSRIKGIFRTNNGHISLASNFALELATGEFIALFDHDDLLAEHALYCVAEAINSHSNVGIIYSDEDKIDSTEGRHGPYFKPDWNYDLFLSHNMVSHLGVFRRDLVKRVGGFREGYEGSQDYDLALRCIECLSPEQIIHIPRVLYHWRKHEQSTALSLKAKPYALVAANEALNDHFVRIGVNAKSEISQHGYRVRYELPAVKPTVSIIILARDEMDHIKRCLNSIITKTTYPTYEIIVLGNRNTKHEISNSINSKPQQEKIRVILEDSGMSDADLINFGVNECSSNFIALIASHIEVLSPGWLEEMLSIAYQPSVGAVGAKLLSVQNTILHGGYLLGVGKGVGDAHRGFPRNHGGYWGRLSIISGFSAVSGECLAIKSDLFRNIGGMSNTNLPIAWNDIDLCLRLAQKGYRNVWTPYAEFRHYASATCFLNKTSPYPNISLKVPGNFKRYWAEWFDRDPAYNPNLTNEFEDFSLAWPSRVKPFASL